MKSYLIFFLKKKKIRLSNTKLKAKKYVMLVGVAVVVSSAASILKVTFASPVFHLYDCDLYLESTLQPIGWQQTFLDAYERLP